MSSLRLLQTLVLCELDSKKEDEDHIRNDRLPLVLYVGRSKKRPKKETSLYKETCTVAHRGGLWIAVVVDGRGRAKGEKIVKSREKERKEREREKTLKKQRNERAYMSQVHYPRMEDASCGFNRGFFFKQPVVDAAVVVVVVQFAFIRSRSAQWEPTLLTPAGVEAVKGQWVERRPAKKPQWKEQRKRMKDDAFPAPSLTPSPATSLRVASTLNESIKENRTRTAPSRIWWVVRLIVRNRIVFLEHDTMRAPDMFIVVDYCGR